MGGELLLETGALVGLLDRSQSVHQACVDVYSTWQVAVVTTEAVLTESTHLLSAVRGGDAACIDLVLQGGIVLIPSSDVSLKRCRSLLEKYADLPIDFADATLIVAAEELNTDLVFTFDSDFHIYRIGGRKRFRILPDS